MLLPVGASASPWLEVGELALRHDLQLLADAGVLTTPTTTWPIPWGAIARDLQRLDPEQLEPAWRAAWRRLAARVEYVARYGELRQEFELNGRTGTRNLRWFNDTPRSEAEFRGALEGVLDGYAFRLSVEAVEQNEFEQDRYRFDDSYAAATLGNWVISAGALDQWWGPGWSGSLILGNTARPVPALMLQRLVPETFDSRWLSWVGPWSVTAFYGFLEEDRFVPNAELVGLRLTVRPLRALEIGLSRTAQWGGDGRPQDFDVFADLVLGQDNQEGPVEAREPGNQLAGVDLRWSSALFGQGLAFYAQAIGEDEAGYRPSRYIGQLGLELWGGTLGGVGYRGFVEYADTAAEFYDDPPRYNYAYENGIYRSGYRYRGSPLGYPTDNDSQITSLGTLLIFPEAQTLSLLLRVGEINRDGTDVARADGGGNFLTSAALDVTDLEIEYMLPTRWGEFTLGVGAVSLDAADGESDTDGRAWAGWRIGT